MSQLKNVVLTGASGMLGSKVLEALLVQDKHHITVVTRQASTATFPDNVRVAKGDYNDSAFLETTFQGQDVVVNLLGLSGLGGEERLVEAAAKAGVQYVVPSEYGAPSEDPAFLKNVPLMKSKIDLQNKIKSLGVKYIVVSPNPWLDYCLERDSFSIDIAKRTATLFTDSVSFTTTTTNKTAAAVAKLLALPIETIDEKFANRHVYLSSFKLTQPELFDAVLKSTNTSKADWTVEESTSDILLKKGSERMKKGDHAGLNDLILGTTYQVGDYAAKLHNDVLGLEQENLEEVIQAIVKSTETGLKTASWAS